MDIDEYMVTTLSLSAIHQNGLTVEGSRLILGTKAPHCDTYCTLNRLSRRLISYFSVTINHRCINLQFQIVLHQTERLKTRSQKQLHARGSLQATLSLKAKIEVSGQISHLSHKRISPNLALPAPCSRSKSAISRYPFFSESWYGV